MKPLEFVDSAIKLFQSDQSRQKRYTGEVSWLNERKKEWSNNEIRIGVLGVTSSGKSTLINAVIGQELLSSACRPTSGQIVCCCKGSKPKVVISFDNNSNDLVLAGNDVCKDKIKKYSDENENRKNKENVKQLRIETPKFDLGNDVILIDSPGLDAHGLEVHEKLTLETLLPSIDMCILVTTLKPSSDNSTKTVLDAIARHGCPLLIVQNMLDSVKAKPNGTKSKADVARDHHRRLEKIINKSGVNNKAEVKVIQMSACYAKDSRCFNKKENEAESYYYDFKQEVNNMIEEKLPEIDKSRYRMLANRYIILIENEKQKAKKDKPTENLSFKYDGLRENLDNSIKANRKKIDKKQAELEKYLEAQLNIIKNCTESNIETTLNSVTDNSNIYMKNILSDIYKIDDKINKTLEKLNISGRDFIKPIRVNEISGPQIIESIETKTVREKKTSGPFGGDVARFFGEIFNNDWGYEDITKTFKKTDIDRTIKRFINDLSGNIDNFKRSFDNWEIMTKTSLDKIYIAIDNEYSTFLEQQKEIEDENEVLRIVADLEVLLKNIAVHVKNDDVNNVDTEYTINIGESEAEYENISLTKYQHGLYNLSKIYLQKLAKNVILNSCEAIGAPVDMVILGWACESIEDFITRNFGSSFNPDESGLLENNGAVKKENLLCIDCAVIENKKTKTIKDILSICDIKANKSPRSYFVLINAQQAGNTRKIINTLAISDYLTGADKVFFVVQDFTNHVNSGYDSISEMKEIVNGYYKEFLLNDMKGLVFIDDENPLYNIAYVQRQLEPNLIEADEHRIVNVLKDEFKPLWSRKEDKRRNQEKIIAQLLRK